MQIFLLGLKTKFWIFIWTIYLINHIIYIYKLNSLKIHVTYLNEVQSHRSIGSLVYLNLNHFTYLNMFIWNRLLNKLTSVTQLVWVDES